MTGRAAFLGELNSPATISRLISRPTTKKNIDINRSFTQKCSGLSSSQVPAPSRRLVSQKSWKGLAHAEFANSNARIVQTRRTPPLAASMCKKRRIGAVRRRIGVERRYVLLPLESRRGAVMVFSA